VNALYWLLVALVFGGFVAVQLIHRHRS